MLINSANNDQNIDRARPKMSESLSGHNHHNNAKLSNPSENLFYAQLSQNSDNNLINRVYDHMYASETIVNSKEVNATNPNCQSAESEVKFLKDWLILHLDLIQQQNDEILSKEKTILILQQENEMLKERISCMERGSPFHSEKFCNAHNSPPYSAGENCSEDMTQDSGPSEEDNKDHIQLLDLECVPQHDTFKCENEQTRDQLEPFKENSECEKVFKESGKVSEVKKDVENNVSMRSESECDNSVMKLSDGDFAISSSVNSVKSIRMNIRRKRFCSNSSAVSNNDSVVEEKRTCRRVRKRRKLFVKDDNILTCSEQYVTHSGEVAFGLINEQEVAMEMAAAAADSANLEVPRWRTKVYTSCYTMEGTENLDDEVYNKRHSRLENDERRRKRWDVQRIREQRVIEKLKQRQERNNLRNEEQQEQVHSLWPTIDDIRFLEVSEQLPVSAFGVPIPRLTPSEFSLPWLNNPHRSVKKVISRKSNPRRRSTRR